MSSQLSIAELKPLNLRHLTRSEGKPNTGTSRGGTAILLSGCEPTSKDPGKVAGSRIS